ncbi:hypothetical protein [Streptomyces sp. NPDC002722]|uniref:hypothetical protein n=1 Tax=Streptomyces sp. NPDC002722 TaxID=3154425 RepID=UPI003319DE71
MAIAYLLSLLVAVAVLAVALRPRPVPTPPPTDPPAFSAAAGLPPGAEAEVRVILVAAAQLAARLAPAA